MPQTDIAKHQRQFSATQFYHCDDPTSLFPSSSAVPILPPIIISLMAPFRSFFTAPVWEHVLALVSGTVLAPGKRTVSAALRIMGFGRTREFALYHYVLNRARWNSRAIARPLLTMILDRFLPVGPVVIGLDDTIERRWGRRIAARGIYRDPVRSSHGISSRGAVCVGSRQWPWWTCSVKVESFFGFTGPSSRTGWG